MLRGAAQGEARTLGEAGAGSGVAFLSAGNLLRLGGTEQIAEEEDVLFLGGTACESIYLLYCC